MSHTSNTESNDTQDHPLAAEAQPYEDDSAIGDDDDLDSTASLTASIYNFREENGRTYNSYGDRDLQHHLLKMTFGLSGCGIDKRDGMRRVLDIGTGTGIWAIEYGDLHPESIVTGIDVSPVMPSFVPPNVRFEVADVERPWTFSYEFDFIFSRMMTGAISNWKQLIQRCFDNLSPGGFFELQDISFNLRSDDGTLSEDSALAKWAAYMLHASVNVGSPLNSVESVKSLMIDAGFVDVVQHRYYWPQNSWPADPKLKKIGIWTYHDFTCSLSGISMALFTRGLGWTVPELETFLIDVRKDMKNTSIHAYWPMFAISGKKPDHPAAEA
ncbi:hypothetical protein A1O3_00686 [Capronia epimyces CBS 606.96]|uniref:Methyltransferase domain-containing protein n=1 Tax=Capronia epimyces CBS 606.96 TaxID=1182542 RepID=W9YS95_9EURO|nr:uncharacterized protein A1O3_00686 [Capronia epimyces CBS 606.96]EXJ92136.1 hypothetical protein A1O3_00686 [Capronia epimyces CBS 606.96]